ncbi:cysteine hydrolase family protein [Agrobacterium sp. T29]|uniref:cysteine hydrolase family protein n=1 Tax=Agrobacterium sp. T29 TaxID=2580515 RepID=UPI00115D64B4|nr:isochorismatase family cysteine hydrolase [Agrobacterium sp. T29]
MERTAFLILDMQNELIDPKGKVGSKGFHKLVTEKRLIPKIAEVEAAMRAKSAPVIFVRVGFEPGYIDSISRQSRLAHLKESGAMILGEFGTEFPSELSPKPGDLVVTKRAVSPFHNTNLYALLEKHRIERIVLAGVYTHMVVDSTARFGDDSGLYVTVLSDCCASPDEQVHQTSVDKILPLFSTVTTQKEFLDDWNARS